MADWTLFHNPRCSKSRGAKELLDERAVEYDVVEYLDSPPSRDTLARLVGLVGGTPSDLVRTGDSKFTEAGLSLAEDASASEVVELLVAHPEVMQRPVIVRGDRAVIGRPPENLLSLLD